MAAVEVCLSMCAIFRGSTSYMIRNISLVPQLGHLLYVNTVKEKVPLRATEETYCPGSGVCFEVKSVGIMETVT